jgi:hypothetical protein
MRVTVGKLRRMVQEAWKEPSLERRYGPSHDLQVDYGNTYWRVVSPVDVEVYTGKTRSSNTYIGASNLLSQETRTLTLKPGDEIHALVGGVFAVPRKDRPREVYVRDGLWLTRSGKIERIPEEQALNVRYRR